MLIAQKNLPASDRQRTVTLSSFRERSRPVLVFAPTNVDPGLLMQIRLFAKGHAELQERQVVLVPVSMSHISAEFPTQDCVYLTTEESAAVRQRLHISLSEFMVVLLGKDGDEKFRSPAPVTIKKLDAIIDAMPMRKQEVHDGNAK